MIFDRVRSHYVNQPGWGEPSREAEYTFGDETYEVYKWDAKRHPDGVNFYATNGASSYVPASRKHRFEIFMGLLPEADDVALSLAKAASFPTREKTDVSDGDTITFQDPLWPGTAMRSLLITRPLQELVPQLKLEDGTHAEFLQALPLHDSELALIKKEGPEALLERWRSAPRVKYWNPNRPPSV